MEKLKIEVIGEYEGSTFHYVVTKNKNLLLNATDIEKHFGLNLSDFLESEEAKRWIRSLLTNKPKIEKYKVDDVEHEFLRGDDYELEDVILIEDGVYFLHKFLIYELCKPFNLYYWWMDEFFWKMMSVHHIK